ncbi:MAG TPA: family 10 glycosylhydrolase [Candidatus Dormibacteraeota bacterium]|nr:family 10 glycosylhydrolase [Candidatus Dormibacteraeota bacterium]
MARPVGVLLVLMLLSCTNQAGTATVPGFSPAPSPIVFGTPQYRALWVDAFHDGIKSPAQVEKLVADAHRANLNALIVQVRKAGDAYFNLSDEPRANDINGPSGFDPLAYVIRLAHAAVPRIEVHAWVNTFFAGESSQVYLAYGDMWGNRASDGSTSGYLDPGVPEVQIYTHKVFMDIAKNYDVDGLHLDFIRYPGSGWGYSPDSVSLYMLETGTQVAPSPNDPTWQAWRRARVTGFVRDLHDDLQRVKPGVKLSGALICFGSGPATAADWTNTAAYGSVFQDWNDWLSKGYLDFGVPMNYDSDWSTVEKGWLGQWLNFEKDSGYRGRIVTGLGAFLNYPEGTLAQIARVSSPSARGNHVLGVAIYSYASTSVYGTDDFYTSPDLAAGLPRQPYNDGITDQVGLANRARTYNNWFITQLSQPDYYRDVQMGWVATSPVFTKPALVPALSAP